MRRNFRPMENRAQERYSFPEGAMTITLELAPEIEARLVETARREREDATATAHRLLAEALKREARERAEAAAGIQRGLDDFAAGRYSSASEAFAGIRKRYGITGE